MDAENKHIDPVGLLPKYFAGEAEPEERKLVDDWLSADESNRKEFQVFKKLWNMTGSVSGEDGIDLDAEWHRLESFTMPAEKAKTVSLVRIVRIAASVVLISALAFIGFKINSVETEKAPVAALSTIKLPDGTTISLNAGSKIAYQKGFGVTNRNLILKGEAYFEVAEDSSLPFVISSGEASIEVTGTSFNVRAYKDKPEIKITVTEGSVFVYDTRKPGNKTTLHAGETGIFNKAMKTVQKHELINMNDIAWKTKIIDFDNTPLTEVADILENTYHKTFEIDPSVQSCSITVHFDNQDLGDILRVMESTLDLEITAQGKRIIIFGDGC
ncbi:MAG: FecR domain-containing protein [Bacteroidales bacterium]|nr:FecR domain-containing protein [Bacteroidales bacterium]